MINLLVVDDEPIIVNSLYQMLRDRDEWQLEVFKAGSGSQALEIARSNRIDIILSDICMPSIDGLQLHKLVQAEWPACKTIFLTGYDSFDYAQQAIRQNGAGYVLKVEGDAAILEALRKCIKEIETEKVNQKLLQSVKTALPLLRREFVQELLQNRQFTADEFNELMQTMEFPLDPNMPVLLLLARVRRMGGGSGIRTNLRDVFNVVGIMDEYLGSFVRQITISQPQDSILTLYQPKPGGNWQSAYRHVLETLEQIQDSGTRLLGLSTAYAAASRPCGWDCLAAKYDELEEAARFYALDERSIITDEMIERRFDGMEKKTYFNGEHIMPMQHQLAQLKLCINNGDEEGMNRLLNDFYTRLRTENVPTGVGKDIYYSLALIFQRCMNELSAYPVKWSEDPARLMNMESHFSWGKVFEYFKNIGRSIIISRSCEKTTWNEQLVEQINEYVCSHLSEDIGLITVAERFHFHASYLARLYKHVTGNTLGQYIMSMKMNRAMDMLAQQDIQVTDVAKSLGFSSVAYFGKFFKANCGQTPSDYRRQILMQE